MPDEQGISLLADIRKASVGLLMRMKNCPLGIPDTITHLQQIIYLYIIIFVGHEITDKKQFRNSPLFLCKKKCSLL